MGEVKDAREHLDAIQERLLEREKELGELREKKQRLKDKDPKTEKREREVESRLKLTLEEIEAVKPKVAKLERKEDRAEAKLAKAKKRKRQRSKKASENFWYDEWDCRDKSFGPVPSYMHDDLRFVAEKFLEPLREEFGPAYINSGHRPEKYNVRIGGAQYSFHVYENRKSQPATDVMFARGTPAQWAASARRIANQLGLGGVGQYDGSGFIHIDTGPRRDWWG